MLFRTYHFLRDVCWKQPASKFFRITNLKYRTMAVPPLNEIRNELQQFKSGRVVLSKDEESKIATLFFENIERKNSLSGSMMVELSDAVTELENWENGKAVILCSDGEVFCSGGDLTMIRQISSPEGGRKMACYMHNTLNRLLALPQISVALVSGKAIGGGAELSTACDFRVMTPKASIQFVHVKMGIVTGWGGGTRLVRLLGSRQALKLLMASKKVEPNEALELGLADAVLNDSESYLVQTKQWLSQFIFGDPEVVQTMKSVVAGARELPDAEAFRREVELFSSLFGGSANQRALSSNIKHH